MRTGRVLREPLLHFVLLGALIFGVASLRRDSRSAAPDRIVVTQGQIEHLASGFTRTWQRSPTPAELDGLVADWVRDEVYYREGLLLGLDRDDTVIRRRIRQKMEFMVDDAALTAPPSDAELQSFLDAHPDRFRREPAFTFRHVYVDADRHGDHAEADAHALLARLVAAGPDADLQGLGDRLMLPDTIERASASEVARLFGEEFAGTLSGLALGAWAGPIVSGYGLHLVSLRARDHGVVPALDEIRADVARAYESEARQRMLDAAYDRLRARYEMVVEVPKRGGDAAVAAR